MLCNIWRNHLRTYEKRENATEKSKKEFKKCSRNPQEGGKIISRDKNKQKKVSELSPTISVFILNVN
jgi:hypothetical protein